MRQVMSPKLTEKEQRVADALVNMHVEYDVQYLGESVEISGDGNRWEHDRWEFSLVRRDGNPNFSKKVAEMLQQPYRTGTGHRKFPRGAIAPRPPYTPNTLAWENWQNERRAVRPPIAGMLHSLIMDTDSATEIFEDWCANFGFDPDSIKALKAYHACQEIHGELRRFFTSSQLEELRTLLEDY